MIFTERPTDGPTDWLSDRRMVSYRYWVIHCKKRASLSIQIEFLGPFVRRLISATLGLNLIHVSLFLCSKAFKGKIFLILFRTFNDQITKKKNWTEFSLSDLKSNFTLILGYLHPALSNPGQIVTLMWSLELLAIRLVAVTCNFWQGRGGGQWSEHQSSFLLSLGFATLPRSRSAFSMKEAWSLAMTRELKGTTTGRLSLNLLPFRFLISCKRGHWSCKDREIV